jgi:hypothetical protein
MPIAIWPILGSMFMFRLMVYMYDVKHGAAPVSPTRSLSYFFLLPNVCFPLFPVVDYETFCLNYYDDERNRIHQVGVRWIFRGVIHLLLYRILYKDYTISLYDVANAGDLVHYCLWLFLLYLRVSGQFHIVVGILRLYGFNLPETHKLYYLSSSFTDFWRRINIYWKDFMMKLFFNPLFFRLRRRGPMTALVISTLAVFFLTWLLHAVQWFWLRGSFLWTASDVLFWSILAVLVVFNSIWELTHDRPRASLGRVRWRMAMVTAVKTLATFIVICVLWSLWTSESLSAWLTLWQFALVPPTAGGWLLIGASLAAIAGSALLLARYPAGPPWARLSFFQESAVRCALIVLLLGVSISAVHRRLGPLGSWVMAARSTSLNQADQAELERGYYEDLLAVDKFNLQLFDLYSRRPPEWNETIVEAGFAKPTGDFQRFEIVPSKEGMFKGAMFRTNRWGMHDREYSQEPPPRTFRIALVGASHAMGTGVEQENTFEALVETRLNQENERTAYDQIEILNFAVWAYRPIQQIRVLQEKVLPFKPNMLFYVEHPGDNRRLVLNLVEAIKLGVDPPGDYLRQLIAQAGVDRSTPEPLIRRRLSPFIEDIISWVYKELVGTCQAHGITPVFISLPTVNPDQEPANFTLARAAGFKIIDLKGVYSGRNWWELILSEWDAHPTAEGHRMVADRLYRELRNEGVIPIGFRADFADRLEEDIAKSPESDRH